MKVFIGLTVGIMLFVVMEVCGQGYVFGPNVRVSDYPPGTATSYTPNAGQRGVAVRGDTVYCVWADNRSGDYDVWFSKSTDGGETFLPNVRVDDGSGVAGYSSIAVGDDRTIYIAFDGIKPGFSYIQVYFTKSTDGGLTFTPEVLVNDTAGGIQNHPHRFPSMAVDSAGVIYIAFDDARNGRYDIYFSKSIDGGETFLEDVMVNDSLPWESGYRTNPGLAGDNGGNVYVVWEDASYHSWQDIYFSRSTDGGMTFLPDVAVSDTDSCLYRLSPSVNIDGRGYIHCVWYKNDTNANIFYSRSTDGGLTFISPILVNDSIHESDPQADPSMCVDDSGMVYAVWEDGPATYSDIYFTLSTDTGDSVFVEPNVLVDETDSASWSPSIVVGDSGKVYVLWKDYRNGFINNDVFFAMGQYDPGVEEEEVKSEEGRVSISTPFPNPFTDRVEIRYCIGQSAERTELKVYDLSGRVIKTLVSKSESSGIHRVVWDGKDNKNEVVSSGVYFLRGSIGKQEVNKKVIYLYTR